MNLAARKGALYSFSWKNHKLNKVTIKARNDYEMMCEYKDHRVLIKLAKDEEMTIDFS